VRLAVLAADSSAATATLADLLTVQLAQTPGVETVERAEIERVQEEQKLTAEGLVEASTRVQLGRILRAAGLVFVQREAGGDRILIRLVETRGGFVACFSTWPAKPQSQAVAIAAALGGMLPKLGLDLSRQTAVSLLRFSTALLPSDAPHPLEARFEALMTTHLMEHLCKESGIVVTERRKLGDVAREKQLSAGTGELTVGVLLVDGELVTSEHLRTPDGDEMVTLTVRIRDMASGSQTPIVQSGARKDLGRLMANAAEAAADAVLKHRQARRKGELPQGEAESLLFLARQKRIVWAGEAAYALDPTNRVVQNAYLKSLLGEASFTQRYRAVPRDV